MRGEERRGRQHALAYPSLLFFCERESESERERERERERNGGRGEAARVIVNSKKINTIRLRWLQRENVKKASSALA